MMITRQQFLRSTALAAALAALPASALAAAVGSSKQREEAIAGTVSVPFDYAEPADGTFELEYLLRRPFDSRESTVFVVTDGQQFFIRKDLEVDWAKAFGPSVNVVGMAGRGFSPELQRRVGAPSGNGWIDAYRLLRYEQWADDIESVREKLLGSAGKICLWGGSGGGRLVHEYLSRHGTKVSRAFTESALNSLLDAQFGFDSDRFWKELSTADQKLLSRVLQRDSARRDTYVQLFQRQNFFVGPDQLASARHQLIEDLADNHEDVIVRLRKEYQVDAINALEASPAGAAIRVRLFEFAAPVSHAFDPQVLRPDHEDLELVARPLLTLMRAGQLPRPAFNFANLHKVDAEVTMLAGFADHTADYRSQVALASHYPNGQLIILDDNHEFDRLHAIPGAHAALVQGALQGRSDPSFAAAVRQIAPIVWRER